MLRRLFVAGIVIATLHHLFGPAEDTRQPPPDPAQTARAAATRAVAQTVFNEVTDPESLRWEQSLASESGDVVCLRFRARNGLGGMVRNHVTYSKGRVTQDVRTWNRLCTKSMHDMSHITWLIDNQR